MAAALHIWLCHHPCPELPRAQQCPPAPPCLPSFSPFCFPCFFPPQVENEYGFCGEDKDYLRHLIATARAHLSPDVLLFTTDPPNVAPKGSIAGEEVYTVVDFGPGAGRVGGRVDGTSRHRPCWMARAVLDPLQTLQTAP